MSPHTSLLGPSCQSPVVPGGGNEIIIMYIYHALIKALSAHIMHINLNTIFCMYAEDSPTKTVYVRHYVETHALVHKRKRTHTMTVAETGY